MLKLVALATLLPALVAAALGWWASPGRILWWPGVIGWAGTLLAVPAAWWLLRSDRPRPVLWAALLVAELLAPTILLPEVRPQEQVYPAGPAVGFLAGRDGRVLDAVGGERSVLGVGAPLALVDRVEAVRGYNPLDVAHYREYLARVAGDPGPVRGNSPLAQQVIPDFVIQDRPMLDRLGVRWLVWPDGGPLPPGPWRPVWHDPAPPAVPPLKPGAARVLPPHTVYENPQAFPRAWVEGEGGVVVPARVVEARPNRVRVELPGPAGQLVLADVWFPGWVCRVDGAEVPIKRAHHAFRAVAVPAGAREAVFTFEPRSYRIGWWVSLVTTGLLSATGVARVLARWRSKIKLTRDQ